METLLQDIRYGLRMLQKSPAFTIVAVFTLALGIGASTAIFSVVNAVLLRPLPYRDPSNLVSMTQVWPKEHDANVVPSPDYTNWRTHAHTFQTIAAYDGGGDQLNLTGAGEPERIEGVAVSASFFDLVGIQPFLGRGFLPEEDQPDGSSVVVLSYDLWQRRFGLNPNIVGNSVTLNGESYTVVGIMPKGFRFPDNGVKPDCILPFGLPPNVDWYAPRVADTRVLARLRAGIRLEQARAELTAINQQGASQVSPPFARMRVGMQVRVITLQQKLVGDVRPALLVLLGAVGFVLLIACANIANLQLVRTGARLREFAVRSAIGAGQPRLRRQLFTESFLLAALGGVAGSLVAVAGVHVLRLYAPDSIASSGQIWIDQSVLGFTLALTCITGTLFGMAPVLGASKLDVNETSKEGNIRTAVWHGQTGVRKLLVIVELALALVLLVGSGLLIRSFARLMSVNPGFDPSHMLTAQVTLPEAKYSTPEQRRAFLGEILRRLEAIPGVQHASLTSVLPLMQNNYATGIRIEGEPSPPPGAAPSVPVGSISSDFFRTMGIPLLAGRFFDEHDGTQAEIPVIVDQTFAGRFFRDKDPIGKRIRIGSPTSPWRPIVGVTGDVKDFGLNHQVEAEIYSPYIEDTRPDMKIAVRSAVDPTSLSAAIRAQVAAVDANQPIYDVAMMEQRLSESLASPRFNTVVLGVFAAFALLLATMGIYGVIAYFVAQRTHEIGIRIALGARPRNVLRLVMSHGFAMTGIGLVLGVAGALALTRYLSSLLFAMRPTDLTTILGVALLLGSVSLLASYIPARRATKVDPMVALRYE